MLYLIKMRIKERTRMISIAQTKRVIIACLSVILIYNNAYALFPTLTKNDPFPPYTSIEFVDDTLLILKDELALDVETAALSKEKRNCVSFSISPFAQNANTGHNIKGEKVFGGYPLGLGDLTGRTSMIALMFGQLPEGKTLPPTLQTAFEQLFPGVLPGTIDDGNYIDPKQLFGYFSFPLKYRKRGVRFEISAYFGQGFGGIFQTGVASIRQTVTDEGLCPEVSCIPTTANIRNPNVLTIDEHDPESIRAIDLTPVSADDSLDGIQKQTVECYLMSQLKPIAAQLGLNICDFCATSIDIISLSLFWRNGYELNRGRDQEWPHVVIIPYVVVGTEISPGKKQDPNELFSVPFGNNGHTSVGFRAGLSFDFMQTIEIGAEGGIVHFFGRDVNCLRVPNSRFQTGIFPFTTDATVKPGQSWFFGLRMFAFHFIDNLSLSFEYLMIEHKKDRICLKNCNTDSAFLPDQLSKITTWKSKMANVGFTYDISPNLGLGFLWQAPISQRNSYKSTTLMLTFHASF